jgi:hypothetical protein
MSEVIYLLFIYFSKELECGRMEEEFYLRKDGCMRQDMREINMSDDDDYDRGE